MKRTFFLASAFAFASFSAEIQANPKPRSHSWNKRFDLTQKASSFKESGIDFFFADMPQNQLVNGRDLSAIPGETLPERLSNEMQHQPQQDPFSFVIDENFYQLTQSYDSYQNVFAGQLVAYHNRSDDIDVNLQVTLDGDFSLKPHTTYLIRARLDFVSNAPAGRPGIGGSVDSNIFGLAVSQSPWMAEADDPTDPHSMLRTFTLDEKGNKAFLGVPSGLCTSTPATMLSDEERFICERYSYMGRICNGLDDANGEDNRVWRANTLELKEPLKFRTDAKGGPLYLNLNSHSGFEGLTVYYVQGIDISVEEVKTDLM